jgi:hypothetical protein
MRIFILIIIGFCFFSCKKHKSKILTTDEYNENIKTLVFIKGDSIKNNYYKYRNDTIMNDIRDFLNLERISKDIQFKESIEIINKSEKRYNEFNKYNNTKISEIKNLLDSLKISSEFTNVYINDIKSVFNKTVINVNENRKIDSTIIYTYKSLVELLKNECKYEITQNMIYFYNDNCLFLYNIKINKIKQLENNFYIKKRINEIKNDEIYIKYNMNYVD